MARTSHDEVMEQLRATPEWQAVSNNDMALLKKLIAEEEEQKKKELQEQLDISDAHVRHYEELERLGDVEKNEEQNK